MKKLSLILCYVLAIASWVGCQDSSSPVTDVNTSIKAPLLDMTAHIATPAAFDESTLSEEERRVIAIASKEAMVEFSEIIQGAPNWDKANTRVQTALATPSNHPQYIRDQTAAVYMIKAAKTLPYMSQTQLVALGIYTDMLAKNRSPEAGLLKHALQRLDGFWPEERLRSAAAGGLEGAEKFLDARYYCEGCTLDKQKQERHEAILQSQDVFITDVMNSVEYLKEMSQR